jgi:hypothetical protein
MVADLNPAGTTRTTKSGRGRHLPNLLDFWNHKWFQEYMDDFLDKNVLENNGIVSGCVISDGGGNSIDCTSGEAYINGVPITVATPANFPTTGDGFYVAHVNSSGTVVYTKYTDITIQNAVTPDNSALIGFAIVGQAAFTLFSYYNDIVNLNGAVGNITSPLCAIDFSNGINFQGSGEITHVSPAGATYIEEPTKLLKTVSGANEFRTEKDGGIRMGAAENICLQSEDYTTTWQTQRLTVTANAATAPDGLATADKLHQTIEASTHYIKQNITGDTSEVHTEMVFAKADEVDQLLVRVTDISIVNYVHATFNLTTGTIVSSGDFGNGVFKAAGIIPLADGWYLCILIGAPELVDSGTITVYQQLVGESDLNATDGLYLWGNDLKQLPLATPYIPTTVAPVTQTADSTLLTTVGNVPDLNSDFGVKWDMLPMGQHVGIGPDKYVFSIAGTLGFECRLSNTVDNRIILYWDGAEIGNDLFPAVNNDFLISRDYAIHRIGDTLYGYVDHILSGSKVISDIVNPNYPTNIGFGNDSSGNRGAYFRNNYFKFYKIGFAGSEERIS